MVKTGESHSIGIEKSLKVVLSAENRLRHIVRRLGTSDGCGAGDRQRATDEGKPDVHKSELPKGNVISLLMAFHQKSSAAIWNSLPFFRVAHASRVLAMTSRHRGLLCKDCFGGPPKPTREVRAGLALRALPGTTAATFARVWGAQAASLQPSEACRRSYHFGWQPKRTGKLPALPRVKSQKPNDNRRGTALRQYTPLIETGLAGWSRFPAAMDPDPLPGIGADEFFNLRGVERGGIDDVFLHVAGGADGFNEFTNQDAIAVSIPHAAHRNDECIGAQGQHGDGASGAGKMTKERDKDAVALQSVYVCEKAEVPASIEDGETFQN